MTYDRDPQRSTVRGRGPRRASSPGLSHGTPSPAKRGQRPTTPKTTSVQEVLVVRLLQQRFDRSGVRVRRDAGQEDFRSTGSGPAGPLKE